MHEYPKVQKYDLSKVRLVPSLKFESLPPPLFYKNGKKIEKVNINSNHITIKRNILLFLHQKLLKN